MKRHKPKPGDLGKAFYEWLAHLEAVEKAVLQNVKLKQMHPKPKGYYFNERLFTIPESRPGIIRLMQEMMGVDSAIATDVRSSVKYKTTGDTLIAMTDKYERQLQYVMEAYPLILPYPQTTLVIDNVGVEGDTMLMLLDQDRVLPDAYEALGLKKGDKYICASLCLHRERGIDMTEGEDYSGWPTLSHIPVEWHAAMGETIKDTQWVMSMAPGCEFTSTGAKVMKLLHMHVSVWLASLNVAGIIRRKQPGRPPKLDYPAPKHLHKRHERPLYEHLVVELEIDKPDPEQTGGHKNQPKKRLHQVRSFMRHYRTGKTVKVNSHWRGSEKIGVLRKDFEVTMHEETADA